MREVEEWEDADDHDDDTPPFWFPGQHLPEHARLLGLTHHVPDGAILDFAGKLDSAKPVHRITAWAMLLFFGIQVVFALMRVLYLW